MISKKRKSFIQTSLFLILFLVLACGLLTLLQTRPASAGDFSAAERDQILSKFFSEALVGQMKSDADPIIKSFG